MKHNNHQDKERENESGCSKTMKRRKSERPLSCPNRQLFWKRREELKKRKRL
jgi:hypothetical protein